MRPRLATVAVVAVSLGWLGLHGFTAAPRSAPSTHPVNAGLIGHVIRSNFASPSGPEIPAGWHLASARLVPHLLMPRERISVGTFRMAVGGGGNCGREPVASIRRMRAGDALLSIQEYVMTAKMRRHLTRTYSPRAVVRLKGLGEAPAVEWDRSAQLRGARIYRATIPFTVGGRACDALVYTAGRPSSERRDQIDALLTELPVPR